MEVDCGSGAGAGRGAGINAPDGSAAVMLSHPAPDSVLPVLKCEIVLGTRLVVPVT